MIKRTLYFSTPAYLSLSLGQLLIKQPAVEKSENIPDGMKANSRVSIPIEDVAIVVLDHKQITLSHALLAALMANNTALICCNSTHIPAGLMLSLTGNSLLAERARYQLAASLPLKKQLWQQTVQSKIRNQAAVLNFLSKDKHTCMMVWADEVKSGDSCNLEGRAAAYYWPRVFPEIPGFKRDQEGAPPNSLLNYAYAIIRAMVARSLVATGLLPAVGLFHHNRYNHFCLADDIMEPYRAYADLLIAKILNQNSITKTLGLELSRELKEQLLSLPITDVQIDGKTHPMMIAIQHTCSSLHHCFKGEKRKLKYPQLNHVM